MVRFKENTISASKIKKPTVKSRIFNNQDIQSEWYGAIIQSAAEGFLLIKHPQGDILDVNDAFCNMTGYNRKELLSMNIKDIEVGFEQSSEEINRRSSDFERSGQSSFETRHRRKDGKIIDVAVNLRYLDEGLSFCFHRDITKDKLKLKREIISHNQTEKALKESEERYRALIDLGTKIGEAVVILQDIDGKEGMHTYVSDQWPRITGYSREELLEMSAFDLVIPRDRDASLNRHRLRMSGKVMPELFEVSIINKKGEEVPIEITGASTMYNGKPANVVYIRDITERKKLEKTLAEERDKYLFFLNNLPVGVAEIDYSVCKKKIDELKAQGVSNFEQYFKENPDIFEKIIYLSKTININGTFVNNMEANNKEQVINKSDKPMSKYMRVNLSSFKGLVALADGKTQFQYDAFFTTIKGNNKYYCTEGIIAPGYENSWRKVYFSITDTTKRNQAEQELRQYREHLEELVARRNDELIKANEQLQKQIKQRTEYTRALVHELKTPLTAIMSSSEVLIHELNDELQVKLARNTHKSACNLDRRIGELLDLARSEIGGLKIECKSINPLWLLSEVAEETLAEITKKGQSIILDVPGSLSLVWADKDRIKQVFFNLIDNAIKYNRRNGKVTIRAREKNGSMIFEVQDEGQGINNEEREKIFQPYYRLENKRECFNGLGLGLALSKSFVELHKGRIWVKTHKGKGSIFNFSIPLASAVNREEKL